MLAPQSDFLGLEDTTVHLATGGQPPMLKSHRDAFERIRLDKSRGSAGYENHRQIGDQARVSLKSLTGRPARDHAFVGNASEGIARVISAIEWRARDLPVAEVEIEHGKTSGRRNGERIQARLAFVQGPHGPVSFGDGPPARQSRSDQRQPGETYGS